MASRAEELRAYRFAMRRLLGAIVSQRSDAAVPQMRRSGGAIGAGIAVAIVSLAVFAAIGLISPSVADWRRGDAVVLEKETGARFVYIDGALHPVLNYASARLIVGTGDVQIVSVSHSDLAGAPRGKPLGIPGAPDSLPAAGSLFVGGWSVCTRATGATTTVVAGNVSGGRSLGDRAVLGTTSDDSEYLIWHNRRFLIADRDIVVPVPLKGAGSPRPLPDAFVNSLPAGSDLRSIPIDAGQPSDVGGLDTGSIVYTTASNGERVYGLVRPRGVAIVTPLQEAILASEGAGEPVKVTQQAFDGAATSIGVGSDWPSEAPAFASPDTNLCLRLTSDGATSAVTVGAALPPVGAAATSGAARLIVPPGRAVLVRAAAAPGSSGTVAAAPTYLFTDAGERFPIEDADARTSLGYAAAKVLTLPSDLVDALPIGVVLSRTAARRPADG